MRIKFSNTTIATLVIISFLILFGNSSCSCSCTDGTKPEEISEIARQDGVKAEILFVEPDNNKYKYLTTFKVLKTDERFIFLGKVGEVGEIITVFWNEEKNRYSSFKEKEKENE